MLSTLLAITAALFLVTSSNALSIDSSLHVARHHNIAARHPVVKRASSRRCIQRDTTSDSQSAPVASSSSPPTSSAAPAAPAPTPSHAPPSSSPPSSGTGKVGLAWSYGGQPSLANFITSKVSAIYTWNPDKPPKTYGLQYAPMLWGPSQIGDFQNVVKAGYANVVLGFNEPDIPGQSNLDPGTAAGIWKANIQPLKYQGYTLITPVVSYKKSWLQGFFAACDGCSFDHLAAHCYATDPQTVIDYLTDLHTTFGMTIWVTEFACESFTGKAQCNADQVWYFMSTLIHWMDSTPWIAKYFYYGLMTASQININPLNALMNEDGTPSPLGKLYIGSS